MVDGHIMHLIFMKEIGVCVPSQTFIVKVDLWWALKLMAIAAISQGKMDLIISLFGLTSHYVLFYRFSFISVSHSES